MQPWIGGVALRKKGAVTLICSRNEESSSDFLLDLSETVAEMRPKDQEIAILKAEGRTYAEIAKELKVSRARISTVLAFLRERLAAYGS